MQIKEINKTGIIQAVTNQIPWKKSVLYVVYDWFLKYVWNLKGVKLLCEWILICTHGSIDYSSILQGMSCPLLIEVFSKFVWVVVNLILSSFCT